MKKILILANNDVGLYKFRKELIQDLLKENKVYISLPNGEFVPELTKMGCHFIDTPVERRGMNPVTDLFLLKRYFSMVKKIRPDLIITYTIKPNVYGGFVARMLHIDYAINITGLGTAFQSENITKKLVCFLYKRACKRAKVVFFENEGNREVFIKHHLIKERQFCVLHGAGVNLDEYPLTPYPEDQKTIRFLFIGRVMKEKGIDELLEAAINIKSEFSNVEFDIVGTMEDDYKQKLEQMTQQKIVHYYGFQSDVKPYIKNSHCFVLPSYHEGMANTLLECASMGRPLITSNIHGCKEAIYDNGYLCKVQDSHDLYCQLRKFIQLDYNNKKLLASNSRKHMEDIFDKKKVVNQTIKQLFK